MPYIAIQSFPKDEETKRKVVEQINQLFLELWQCPPEAITISVEEIAPQDWEEQVVQPQIEPKRASLYIHNGKKRF